MHKPIAIAALTLACGAALAQNHDIYRVPKNLAEYRPDLSTAPSLAVGLEQIVVVGSHRMTMFDKASPINPLSPQDTRRWGPVFYDIMPNDYPFRPASVPIAPDYTSLIFPQADYDPITGHVWMLYAEAVGRESADPFEPARPEALGFCTPRLHIAASRSTAFKNFNRTLPGPVPDPDGFTYWTDNGPILPDPTGVLGGEAINLELVSTAYDPSAPPFQHDPVTGSLIYPSIGFETDDVIITGIEPATCPIRSELDTTGTQVILFMPRDFAGATGLTDIHDGGRIDEGEIAIARMTGMPNVPDDSFQAVIVQEPYEQWENVALILSTDGSTFDGVEMQNIRLKGVFKGIQGVPTPADSNWRIRQSLTLSGSDFILDDMSILPMGLGPVAGASIPSALYPTTPDIDFRPPVIDDSFTTAVMARDNSGNPRVFAAHAAIDLVTGLWVVQWYVIDPDLGPEVVPATTPTTYQHFHTPILKSTTWSPTIEAMGRIVQWDPEDEVGHCYHPVVGVTRTGQLYVEYTFSSPTVDQRIVRARIDNAYTGVSAYELVQTGPTAGYADEEDRWALYGDMQADPELCRFWSTHALVEDADEREVWLFEEPYFCFTTDMNQSGFTDPFDMVMYNNLFLQEDSRADTDDDGAVDVTDMANYIDAYDKATGP